MNKKVVFLLLFVLAFIGNPAAQDRMPEINDQLAEWLEKIPPGSESDFGFTDRNEFKLAVLGDAIDVYKLKPKGNEEEEQDDSPAIVPTSEWRIPVKVGEESRMLITVVQTNTGRKIVDIGARDLAREIAIIRKQFDLKDNVDLHLLRIHSLACDLLFTGEDPGSANLDFYPLESARASMTELSVLHGKPTGYSKLMPIVMQNQNLRINQNK